MARLKYLARVCRVRHSLLWAILQFRHEGAAIPWIVQLHADLELARRISPSLSAACVGLDVHDFHIRVGQIALCPATALWQTIVSECAFTTSVLDKQVPVIAPTVVLAFACPQCSACFASDKALSQHARKLHGLKSTIQSVVGPGSVCRSCQTDFQQRFRLVAHLSDRRPGRDKCRRHYLAAESETTPEAAEILHQTDLAAQRAATGTHAVAIASATNGAGKRTGRVRH